MALADAELDPNGRRRAVSHMPRSATPEEQLADTGIKAAAIVAGAKQLLGW